MVINDPHEHYLLLFIPRQIHVFISWYNSILTYSYVYKAHNFISNSESNTATLPLIPNFVTCPKCLDLFFFFLNLQAWTRNLLWSHPCLNPAGMIWSILCWKWAKIASSKWASLFYTSFTALKLLKAISFSVIGYRSHFTYSKGPISHHQNSVPPGLPNY